ncbi:MAG: Holliday junction DNA helicase [uncultured bacterium]|nr:MAG: Holliday junction DNA helicase [uncultured bacterium]
MIYFLKGIVTYKIPSWVEIDVNGVGYGLLISLLTYDSLPQVGEPIELHTMLITRENEMSLYGFSSRSEREMFNILMSVSGVGAKVSLAILSTLNEGQIQKAIFENDLSLLSTVPGVGKKTSERLVLELRDKLKNKKFLASKSATNAANKESPEDKVSEDAISALVTLGYNGLQARNVIKDILKEETSSISIEELIRKGLNRLMKL